MIHVLLVLLLIPTSVFAADLSSMTDEELLSEVSRFYGVQQFTRGGVNILAVGEAHFGNEERALDLARELVSRFEHRALEVTPSRLEATRRLAQDQPLGKGPVHIAITDDDFEGSPLKMALGSSRTRERDKDFGIDSYAEPLTKLGLLRLSGTKYLLASAVMFNIAASLAPGLYSAGARKGLRIAEIFLTVIFISRPFEFSIGEKYMQSEDQPWYPYLFSYRYGLITQRDRVMAANLDTLLKTHTEIKNLLVLVGKAHLPGITKLLTEKYGFQITGSVSQL